MRDPIAQLKHELLAAAERQRRHTAASTGRGRVRLPFGRYRLPRAATVVVAAAAALFVSSPWETAPGFLGRVQAAVAPPPGSILRVKWELTSISRDLRCKVTHGPNEIWIDQTPPQRFRVLLSENEPFGGDDLRALACSGGGMTAEIGGTFDAEETRGGPSMEPSLDRRPTLRFVPPNTLSSSYANWPFYFDDPVEHLREWLASGRAHDEGTMSLDGRTVRRIRIDPPADCPVASCPSKPNYAYVDPESFYPVQLECEDCGGIALPGRPIVRLRLVTRFLAYEPLLPRTEANLALTDIRAQHPNAVLSSEPPIRLPKLSGAVAKTVRAAKGAKDARVTFDVTATASDGSDIDVSCLPKSGSRFPLGKTIVHCEATDASTSTNSADFTVTVTGRR